MTSRSSRSAWRTSELSHAAHVLLDAWAEYVGGSSATRACSPLHRLPGVRPREGRPPPGSTAPRHGSTRGDRYVDTALAHLRAGAVTLVLIGGPPASGKTTLSGAVADRLGMSRPLQRSRPQGAALASIRNPTPRPTSAPASTAPQRRNARTQRCSTVPSVCFGWESRSSWTRPGAPRTSVSRQLLSRSRSRPTSSSCAATSTPRRLCDGCTTASHCRTLTRQWPRGFGMSQRPGPRATWSTPHMKLEESVEQACGLIRPHPAPGACLRRRPHLVPDYAAAPVSGPGRRTRPGPVRRCGGQDRSRTPRPQGRRGRPFRCARQLASRGGRLRTGRR